MLLERRWEKGLSIKCPNCRTKQKEKKHFKFMNEKGYIRYCPKCGFDLYNVIKGTWWDENVKEKTFHLRVDFCILDICRICRNETACKNRNDGCEASKKLEDIIIYFI